MTDQKATVQIRSVCQNFIEQQFALSITFPPSAMRLLGFDGNGQAPSHVHVKGTIDSGLLIRLDGDGKQAPGSRRYVLYKRAPNNWAAIISAAHFGNNPLKYSSTAAEVEVAAAADENILLARCDLAAVTAQVETRTRRVGWQDPKKPKNPPPTPFTPKQEAPKPPAIPIKEPPPIRREIPLSAFERAKSVCEEIFAACGAFTITVDSDGAVKFKT